MPKTQINEIFMSRNFPVLQYLTWPMTAMMAQLTITHLFMLRLAKHRVIKNGSQHDFLGHLATFSGECNQTYITLGETTGQYLFSATLTEDQTFDGTPIVFDQVLTNRGGLYSDLSGVFFAPGNSPVDIEVFPPPCTEGTEC